MNPQHITSNERQTARNGSVLSWPSFRHLLLVAFAAIALLMAWHPLANLMRTADRGEYYSHIILIPFVTAYFLYQYRTAILDKSGGAMLPGRLVIGGALALYLVARAVQAATRSE